MDKDSWCLLFFFTFSKLLFKGLGLTGAPTMENQIEASVLGLELRFSIEKQRPFIHFCLNG